MERLGVTKRYLTFFIILLSFNTLAKTVTVSPKGEFATIDVATQNQMVQQIMKGHSADIEKVIAKPEDYNPVVLYVLSGTLFKQDKKDEAMFWFYAGQLRARSDANKAQDKSAAQAVSQLNQTFGALINGYAFANIPILEKTVDRVIAWDKNTPRNYDPRWIALHGMDAFTKETVAFAPEESWNEINNTTRQDYFSSFKTLMEQIKKQAKLGD